MNPTDFRLRFAGMVIFVLPLELLLYGMVALAHYADEASRRARERERKAAQLEASLTKARLMALELQTQPHFLFNTLNGISALVRAGQNPQALSMIGGLSDLLRYALERSGGAAVALEEEARTVERYLGIQRIRFADRLAVELDLAPDTLRGAVPALLLQPLAENAVRHGIARVEAPGRIVLRSARRGDDLVIEIFNTGRLDAVRRDGIGMSTTQARLTELHGERGRLEIAEHEGGVLTRVTLPFQEVG
jgi:LytS/YehU family sensor histidine kinase